MKNFKIIHEPGYTLDKNRHSLLKEAGIYIVYKCDYNPQNDTVDVKEVIYIGETDNIYLRHNSENPHEHYDDFVKYSGGAEHICYGEISLPGISEEDRKTIEAALIHIQKPSINTEFKDHYAKSASKIILSGGPDCWKTKLFIHPFDNSDGICIDSLSESAYTD